MARDVYFRVKTPLGVVIRTTKDYWENTIVIKHPSIAKYEDKVKESLQNPEEIRQSQQDRRVHLHYKNIGKVYVCAVADYLSTKSGYLITAYLTDRIKEGERVYVKT